eukprot:TRINITY_DN2740_c0_g1_i2.p1 TRINITY_DN2740_c0_g1~~TRINITY_DN2740_c0_g1_i2.p1  ORF type:complete len:980 (+),score=77.48 TRINITY_DN2740_c0_g1_i2:152-3091(+)
MHRLEDSGRGKTLRFELCIECMEGLGEFTLGSDQLSVRYRTQQRVRMSPVAAVGADGICRWDWPVEVYASLEEDGPGKVRPVNLRMELCEWLQRRFEGARKGSLEAKTAMAFQLPLHDFASGKKKRCRYSVVRSGHGRDAGARCSLKVSGVARKLRSPGSISAKSPTRTSVVSPSTARGGVCETVLTGSPSPPRVQHSPQQGPPVGHGTDPSKAERAAPAAAPPADAEPVATRRPRRADPPQERPPSEWPPTACAPPASQPSLGHPGDADSDSPAAAGPPAPPPRPSTVPPPAPPPAPAPAPAWADRTTAGPAAGPAASAPQDGAPELPRLAAAPAGTPTARPVRKFEAPPRRAAVTTLRAAAPPGAVCDTAGVPRPGGPGGAGSRRSSAASDDGRCTPRAAPAQPVPAGRAPPPLPRAAGPNVRAAPPGPAGPSGGASAAPCGSCAGGRAPPAAPRGSGGPAPPQRPAEPPGARPPAAPAAPAPAPAPAPAAALPPVRWHTEQPRSEGACTAAPNATARPTPAAPASAARAPAAASAPTSAPAAAPAPAAAGAPAPDEDPKSARPHGAAPHNTDEPGAPAAVQRQGSGRCPHAAGGVQAAAAAVPVAAAWAAAPRGEPAGGPQQRRQHLDAAPAPAPAGPAASRRPSQDARQRVAGLSGSRSASAPTAEWQVVQLPQPGAQRSMSPCTCSGASCARTPYQPPSAASGLAAAAARARGAAPTPSHQMCAPGVDPPGVPLPPPAVAPSGCLPCAPLQPRRPTAARPRPFGDDSDYFDSFLMIPARTPRRCASTSARSTSCCVSPELCWPPRRTSAAGASPQTSEEPHGSAWRRRWLLSPNPWAEGTAESYPVHWTDLMPQPAASRPAPRPSSSAPERSPQTHRTGARRRPRTPPSTTGRWWTPAGGRSRTPPTSTSPSACAAHGRRAQGTPLLTPGPDGSRQRARAAAKPGRDVPAEQQQLQTPRLTLPEILNASPPGER